MKLRGSKTENEYRTELVGSRRSLFEQKENQKLLVSLQSYYPDMKTAYVLSWTPEQGEDIYRILINTSTIACVEVDRSDSTHTPHIESLDLKEYEKRLSKTGRINLAVAIDLARSDIERHT